MQELFSNQKPEVLRRLKQSAMIESVESSSRIEGIVAPSDAMPWIEYFWGVLIAAHKEYVRRVADVEPNASKSKRERVLSTIDELTQVFSIKDVLIANPDISREMIKVVIKELKDNGLLTSKGKGRGAKLHKQSV